MDRAEIAERIATFIENLIKDYGVVVNSSNDWTIISDKNGERIMRMYLNDKSGVEHTVLVKVKIQ